jgi:ribonuclease PH
MEVANVETTEVPQFPRNDLRTPYEMRPISVDYDISLESEGSVKVTLGKTCVIALVSGPSQPRYSRHEEFDRATLEIDVRYGSKSSNIETKIQSERKISEFIFNTFTSTINLKQYPRKLILFKVSIIRDDGAVAAACVLACAFALLESGISLSHIPIPVSAAVHEQQDQILLDPSAEEELSSKSLHTIVFNVCETEKGDSELTTESLILATQSIGLFSPNQLLSALALCKDTSLRVKNSLRDLMRQSRHQKSRSGDEE